MNWGGFAGGFAQGFNNGINMGRTIKAVMREGQLEEIRAKGIEEARAAREQDISGQINDTGEAETKTKAGDTVAKASPVEAPNVEERPITDTTPNVKSPTTPAAQGISVTPQATAAITPQTPAAETPATPFAAGIAQPEQPSGRYVVGNQRFATPEQARAAAEKNVGSAQDYILKNVVPKMQEKYIEFGDIESAQKLGDYMESRRGKEATTIFGKAMTAMMTGDTENGVKHFGDYYNKFIDDGIDFKKHSIGEDGKINFTVARKSDGKEFEMSLSRGELLRLGMAHDPARMYANVLDAQKAKEQQAGELAKEDRAFKRDIYKDDRNHAQAKELKTIDQSNAIEKMTIEKQLDAANASSKVKREVNAKVEFLRGAGYSDEFINEALPGIIGIGDFKKRTSPEEARRLAFSDRMKSDPTFGRKPPEEQQKILDQDMKLITGGVDPQRNPAASGLPAQQSSTQTPATKKGVPFYDVKTGAIVYR